MFLVCAGHGERPWVRPEPFGTPGRAGDPSFSREKHDSCWIRFMLCWTWFLEFGFILLQYVPTGNIFFSKPKQSARSWSLVRVVTYTVISRETVARTNLVLHVQSVSSSVASSPSLHVLQRSVHVLFHDEVLRTLKACHYLENLSIDTFNRGKPATKVSPSKSPTIVFFLGKMTGLRALSGSEMVQGEPKASPYVQRKSEILSTDGIIQ